MKTCKTCTKMNNLRNNIRNNQLKTTKPQKKTRKKSKCMNFSNKESKSLTKFLKTPNKMGKVHFSMSWTWWLNTDRMVVTTKTTQWNTCSIWCKCSNLSKETNTSNPNQSKNPLMTKSKKLSRKVFKTNKTRKWKKLLT